MVHGKEEADKALEAARAIFSSNASSANAPTTTVNEDDLEKGINILELLKLTNLSPSNAEGRRLIQQGGITVNDEKITDTNFIVDISMMKDDVIMIRKGKKVFHQVKI